MKSIQDNKTNNLLLTEFKVSEDWIFLKTLKESSDAHWDIRYTDYSFARKGILSECRRMFYYFFFPLIVLLRDYGKYDNILCWQQFYGLNLAFWSRLFHIRKRAKILVMTFIYKEKAGWKGELYHKFMSYILSSCYIDKLFVFSTKEIEYYSKLFNLSEDVFAFIPLGLDPVELCDTMNSDERYILSVGRSNRDYDFLCDAIAGTQYKLKIICDSFYSSVPDNISVLHSCYDEEMLKMMSGAYCVVIPLKDESISSGQMAILQAMFLKKPVIVTRTAGISDYAVDGETCIMIQNDASDLMGALSRIYSDEELYERLCTNAYLQAKTNFSTSNMAQKIAGYIN